jgi:hypothetical protein
VNNFPPQLRFKHLRCGELFTDPVRALRRRTKGRNWRHILPQIRNPQTAFPRKTSGESRMKIWGGVHARTDLPSAMVLAERIARILAKPVVVLEKPVEAWGTSLKSPNSMARKKRSHRRQVASEWLRVFSRLKLQTKEPDRPIDSAGRLRAAMLLVGWLREPSGHHASWMPELSGRVFCEGVRITITSSPCLSPRRLAEPSYERPILDAGRLASIKSPSPNRRKDRLRFFARQTISRNGFSGVPG